MYNAAVITDLGQRLTVDSVNIDAEITGGTCVSMKAVQVFRNHAPVGVTAAYVVPLPSNSSITALRIMYADGTQVDGRAMTTAKAEAEFVAATAAGYRAACGGVVDGAMDLFRVALGNLKAGEVFTVTMTMVSPLTRVGRRWKWCLPSSMTPVHGSLPGGADERKYGFRMTVGVNDTRPLSVAVMKVNTFGDSVVERVAAPEMTSTPGCVRFAAMYSEVHSPSGAIIVELEQEEVVDAVSPPLALVEVHESEGTVAVALRMSGDVGKDEGVEGSVFAASTKFVFAVDTSGSMAGKRLEVVQDALEALFDSLPPDCVYAMMGFQNRPYDILRPLNRDALAAVSTGTLQTRSNVNEHLDSTRAAIRALRSGGGTDIVRALQALRKFHTENGGGAMHVFFMTDGDVENVDQVLEEVRWMAGLGIRLFTLGIGFDPRQQLIEGMAVVGGGVSRMARTWSETEMEGVMDLLDAACKPELRNVSVEVDEALRPFVQGSVMPHKVMPFMPGNQVVVSLLLSLRLTNESPVTLPQEGTVIVRGQGLNGPVEWHTRFPTGADGPAPEGALSVSYVAPASLHHAPALVTRARVRDDKTSAVHGFVISQQGFDDMLGSLNHKPTTPMIDRAVKAGVAIRGVSFFIEDRSQTAVVPTEVAASEAAARAALRTGAVPSGPAPAPAQGVFQYAPGYERLGSWFQAGITPFTANGVVAATPAAAAAAAPHGGVMPVTVEPTVMTGSFLFFPQWGGGGGAGAGAVTAAPTFASPGSLFGDRGRGVGAAASGGAAGTGWPSAAAAAFSSSGAGFDFFSGGFAQPTSALAAPASASASAASFGRAAVACASSSSADFLDPFAGGVAMAAPATAASTWAAGASFDPFAGGVAMASPASAAPTSFGRVDASPASAAPTWAAGASFDPFAGGVAMASPASAAPTSFGRVDASPASAAPTSFGRVDASPASAAPTSFGRVDASPASAAPTWAPGGLFDPLAGGVAPFAASRTSTAGHAIASAAPASCSAPTFRFTSPDGSGAVATFGGSRGAVGTSAYGSWGTASTTCAPASTTCAPASTTCAPASTTCAPASTTCAPAIKSGMTPPLESVEPVTAQRGPLFLRLMNLADVRGRVSWKALVASALVDAALLEDVKKTIAACADDLPWDFVATVLALHLLHTKCSASKQAWSRKASFMRSFITHNAPLVPEECRIKVVPLAM